MAKITIYHNPNCGTSRNVLEMIRAGGEEPEIVEYLKTPLKRSELEAVVKKLNIPVRNILRRKGTPYEELDLDNPKWTDAQLFDFIVEHPILMERPIVVTKKGARLCRPKEAVLEIL